MNRIILFLLAFMPLCISVEAAITSNIFSGRSEKPTPPTIKVLVVQDMPGVILEVKGKYRMYDPMTNDFIANRFTGKRSFIQSVKDGLKWGEGFPGVYQLKIVPDSLNTTTIVDGLEYRGIIYVYDVEGRISIVNEIDIEEYLRSVLSAVIRDPMPEEAIAAATIVARTDAYFTAKNSKNPYWHIDANNAAYRGYAVANSQMIEKVLYSTRHMALSSNAEKTVPFHAQWKEAQISLTQAAEMARKGNDAAGILSKAFPRASLQLVSN